MTVGTHSVVVYADRNAASWGTSIVSNPYFTVNADGWGAEPFQPPLQWVAGTIYMPTGTSIHRNANAGYETPRKPGTNRYRVRAVFTINAVTDPTTTPPRCQVFLHIYLGRTHWDASLGTFWRPDDSAQPTWTAKNAGLGTHVLELEVTVPATYRPEYQFLGCAVQFTNFDGTPNVSCDSLEMHYRSEGGQADISCLLDEVSITQGRTGPEGQPEAAAATLDFTTGPGAPLPAMVDTGAVIVVTTTLALADGSSVQSVRFIGRVTDIALGWESNGYDTPDTGVGQIVAVGLLADLARRVVGSAPFPQELDAARVTRVLNLAGLAPPPNSVDPGTVQILPRDIDSRAALEVIHDTATSANGILWETRGGELRYADSEHRRNVRTYGVVLDACDVDVTPTWTRTLEGLVNQVSIGYGDTPDGSEQPRYVAEAPASVTTWGRYNYSLGSELAALADATALGQLLLARNSAPVWNLSAVPVNGDHLDVDVYRSLLALEMHSLVNLTGMPAIGSAPTSSAVWLEGWTERLAWGVHTFELALSGYCRTAPPPRWNDINPGATWDAFGAIAATNRATNPGVEAGITGWYANSAAVSPLTVDAGPDRISGTQSVSTVRTTSTGSPTIVSTVGISGTTGVNALLVTPGELVTMTVDVKPLAPNIEASAYIRFRDAANANLPQSPTTFADAPANVVTRIGVAATAPAGTVSASLIVIHRPKTGDAVPGSKVVLDNFMVGPGPYFDGSTPDTADTSYSWTGAANASTSIAATGPTWDDAACLGPQSDYGRWDDVSATTRWDDLAPAIAWDSWTVTPTTAAAPAAAPDERTLTWVE